MDAFPLLSSKESSCDPVESPPHPELMHLQTFTAGASWQLHPPPLSPQCLLLGTEAAQRHTSHCAHVTQNSGGRLCWNRTQTHNTLRPVTHMQVGSLKPLILICARHCYCCSLRVAQQLHLEAWRIVGEILRHGGSRQSGQKYGTHPTPPIPLAPPHYLCFCDQIQ